MNLVRAQRYQLGLNSHVGGMYKLCSFNCKGLEKGELLANGALNRWNHQLPSLPGRGDRGKIVVNVVGRPLKSTVTINTTVADKLPALIDAGLLVKLSHKPSYLSLKAERPRLGAGELI